MKGLSLIRSTLILMKTLHEFPESGAIHGALKEQVKLAPKTKEQLDSAIAECNEIFGTEEELRQLFKNRFCCYADCCDVVLAMDEDRFVEVVTEILGGSGDSQADN